ncbi:FKBP-type peptidyl-prolyl cis-trans isomerase [Mucilaginibacter sp. AK015]|uniref:FKBP-type peptidyl-prolyl cis-trans isomerase n=1 Tax=Mucilaginibacter sp. AK015 TaxID=2723072 RepID=UPI0016110CCF|nr:FKBP-type peptidyl-prolyl cis-trans isomerase [Mucilaginibacter sp. AK015]MBB5395720.1 FKBP-type peptidyl-prolyl cis-trans isomerase [Mucilaginibacter sp. AK015]
MKQKIFTFLLIAATGLTACKKNTDNQPDIREYDQQQIQAYISANGLTDFSQDTTKDGTGTTGMYYKIITQGSGDTLKYADRISMVYTLKTLDGKYVSSDTITNHLYEYLGHLVNDNLPQGLQLAVHNLLQHKGASMRVLIPSRLAYGQKGYGSGSITNVNTRIGGNQSLDYYVHVIADQEVYDDKVINNYIAANNLTGYTKDPLGYYYKITTPGTGPEGGISEFSNVDLTYKGTLLNGSTFDESTTAITFTPYSVIEGLGSALQKYGVKGASISMLIPSALGYGTAARDLIPSNSILKYDFQITDIK